MWKCVNLSLHSPDCILTQKSSNSMPIKAKRERGAGEGNNRQKSWFSLMRSRKAFHCRVTPEFSSPSLSLCITKRQWGQGQKPDEAPGVISRNNEPICPPIIPEMTDLNIFPQPGESQSTPDHLLCKCVFHMQASWVSGAVSNYLIRALQL